MQIMVLTLMEIWLALTIAEHPYAPHTFRSIVSRQIIKGIMDKDFPQGLLKWLILAHVRVIAMEHLLDNEQKVFLLIM